MALASKQGLAPFSRTVVQFSQTSCPFVQNRYVVLQPLPIGISSPASGISMLSLDPDHTLTSNRQKKETPGSN